MTNSVGKGTKNTSINLIEEEDAILGRLSVLWDKSKGAILKELYVAGLAAVDPVRAEEIQQIRHARAAMISAFIGLGLIVSAAIAKMDMTRIGGQFSSRQSIRQIVKRRGEQDFLIWEI